MGARKRASRYSPETIYRIKVYYPTIKKYKEHSLEELQDALGKIKIKLSALEAKRQKLLIRINVARELLKRVYGVDTPPAEN